MKIKLLLVDDHQVILDSLKLLFQTLESVEIVSTLNDSRKVSDFIENEAVDIVISDLHMPYLSGIDLCLQLKVDHPKTKIILLTMAEDAPHIREALQAGVHGYVLKRASKFELERAIEQVMAGKKYYSEAVIEELAYTPSEDLNKNKAEHIEKLTTREVEVLKLIAMELSSSEIADSLCISLSTVETHRANLMKKLEVKSAIGMVKYAIKHGLTN